MDEKKKKCTFVLCDGSKVNSYGFKVDVAGINTERFETNPVMLYYHDSYEVIGRWENIRKEDGKLMADAVFDMEDEDAKRIAGKVERGFLKGCSMGLKVVNMIEENGLPIAKNSELLEASICSIPSDSGAVKLYDDDHNELTYEEVKLQFNNNLNNNQMAKENEENVALSQELEEKNQEILRLKAEIAQNKKDAVSAYLTAAVASGKIDEKERADYEKLSESDFETVKKLIDSKSPKATQSLRELATNSKSSERDSWTYMDWMKKDSKGLARLKAENPSEFERLKNTLK